jgi:hypothetical protein
MNESQAQPKKSKEPTLVPMLATNWESTSNPTSWFLQEKFDGVRVVSFLFLFVCFFLFFLYFIYLCIL